MAQKEQSFLAPKEQQFGFLAQLTIKSAKKARYGSPSFSEG